MTRTGYTTTGSDNWTPPARTQWQKDRRDPPLQPMEYPRTGLLRRMLGGGRG